MKDQTKERLHNFHKGFEKNVSPYLFILPFFIFFVVFALTPVVMSLILSFMEWDYSSSATWVGLKNYQLIFDLDTLTGSEILEKRSAYFTFCSDRDAFAYYNSLFHSFFTQS